MKQSILFLIQTVLIISGLCILNSCGTGNELAKKAVAANVESMIVSKAFIFKATQALPMGGTSRTLTGDYDLNVKKDTIVSYLPYFGVAYSAPMDVSDTGIHFSSKKFSYSSVKGKNGWQITIVPKDVRQARQLFLTVSEQGYASLKVTFNNRQPISFNGHIEKGK